jgi:hypothetical protein
MKEKRVDDRRSLARLMRTDQVERNYFLQFWFNALVREIKPSL